MTKEECIKQIDLALEARCNARKHAAMIDLFWTELIETYAGIAFKFTPAESAQREIPFFLLKQAI